MSSIPMLVAANCYGFYLSDPQSGAPVRVALRGGVHRFVERYEEAGYTCDPLRQHVLETRRPAHSGLLFSETEWQGLPLRETLTMRRLARLLEAPLVADGEIVGGLYFTRSPDEAPFSQGDLKTLELVTHQVTVAMGHCLRYSALEERYLLLEAALHLTGAALLLTDEAGEVRFANKQADELLQGRGRPPLEGRQLSATVRENALRILKGARSATSSLSWGPDDRPDVTLVLRTVRIPSAKSFFVSFIYQRQGVIRPDFEHLHSVLSKREIQVIQLLSQGLQNKEIARKLFVSPNTVKYHLKQIYQTLQVGSRAELLMKATRAAGRDERS